VQNLLDRRPEERERIEQELKGNIIGRLWDRLDSNIQNNILGAEYILKQNFLGPDYEWGYVVIEIAKAFEQLLIKLYEKTQKDRQNLADKSKQESYYKWLVRHVERNMDLITYFKRTFGDPFTEYLKDKVFGKSRT